MVGGGGGIPNLFTLLIPNSNASLYVELENQVILTAGNLWAYH